MPREGCPDCGTDYKHTLCCPRYEAAQRSEQAARDQATYGFSAHMAGDGSRVDPASLTAADITEDPLEHPPVWTVPDAWFRELLAAWAAPRLPEGPVTLPVHDPPRPRQLVATHYVDALFQHLRGEIPAQDDYPWRHGLVPGGPYA